MSPASVHAHGDEVTLKAVASVEEFADVSPDVVLQHELAARVIGQVRFQVDYALVKNGVLAAQCNLPVKLLLCPLGG